MQISPSKDEEMEPGDYSGAERARSRRESGYLLTKPKGQRSESIL